MKTTISYFDYPVAKLGWYHALRVLEHICKGGHFIPFIYYRETTELLIVDDKLIYFLKILKVPYELRKPTASIIFIKED